VILTTHGGVHETLDAFLEAHHDVSAAPAAPPAFNLEGLIRDERGIRMAPESDD